MNNIRIDYDELNALVPDSAAIGDKFAFTAEATISEIHHTTGFAGRTDTEYTIQLRRPTLTTKAQA